MDRRLEQAALWLFALLLTVAAWQFAQRATFNLAVFAGLLPALLVALAMADLVSGITHFLLDTRGNETTRFWGAFIRPFREHHLDPQEMTRHDFVHTNGHTAIALCPLLALVLFSFRAPMSATATLQFTYFIALLVFLGLTNQFHKWAHALDAPRFVRWLQANGFVLSQAQHALHHRSYTDHFCITTGWNNGWLAKTQLLQRMFPVVGTDNDCTAAPKQ